MSSFTTAICSSRSTANRSKAVQSSTSRTRPAGDVIGHEFYVFETDVVNGREQLATSHNLDKAISIAAKRSAIVRPTKRHSVFDLE